MKFVQPKLAIGMMLFAVSAFVTATSSVQASMSVAPQSAKSTAVETVELVAERSTNHAQADLEGCRERFLTEDFCACLMDEYNELGADSEKVSWDELRKDALYETLVLNCID